MIFPSKPGIINFIATILKIPKLQDYLVLAVVVRELSKAPVCFLFDCCIFYCEICVVELLLLSENKDTTSKIVSETMEYVIKFQFLPKRKKLNSAVATMHYTILHAIHHCFHDSVIYDNHGNTLSNFSKIKTNDSYSCHFKLLHVIENTNKKCRDMYLVFH